MMGKAIFIFGRNPDFSYLELVCVLQATDISFKIVSNSNNSIVLAADNFEFNTLIDRLAGTTKISEVKIDCPFDSLDSAIANYGWKFGSKKKVKFSLDVHCDAFKDEQELRSFRSWVKGIIKRIASEKHIKAVYEDLSLSDLFRVHSNSIEHSDHIHILIHIDRNKKNAYVSDTHSIFNPMTLKEKTDERPIKDFSIQSSVRMARMMVNISGAFAGSQLLDPFCGLGTILSEGMAIGCNVIGIEIDAQRINAAKRNVAWYKRTYYPKSATTFKLIHGDSTRIVELLKRESENSVDSVDSVDFIVSEPELGPLLRGIPTDSEAKSSLAILEPIYRSFFGQIQEILNEKDRIVIILPEFRTKTGKVFRLNLPELNRFRFVNPTKNLEKEINMPLEISEEWNYINKLLYILEKK